jgi:predicted permease
VLTEASFVGLNTFVYYFALPALFLVRMAEAPIAQLFDWRLPAAYLTGGLTVFLVGMGLTRACFGHRLAVMGLAGLAAAYPNVGYMGLPLMITAFGEAAAVPAMLVLMADVLVTFSVGVAVTEAGLGSGTVARTVALGLGRNPVVLSILVGAAVALARLPLHASLDAFLELLGGAALPCALFALGASLVGLRPGRAAAEVALLAGLKLLLHPFLVWLAATRLFHLGPLATAVVVIEASLPVAATVFVVAQRHELYADRVSAAILLSTALSVVTVSALLVLMAPP